MKILMVDAFCDSYAKPCLLFLSIAAKKIFIWFQKFVFQIA